LKRRAVDDRRALAVKLTARGRTAAKRAAQWPGFVSGALVGSLRDEEQTALYSGLFKLIRELEIQGTMPAHRMCGTCRWFEPEHAAESGARRAAARTSKAAKQATSSTSFYCSTLSQPLDRASLRLDCLAYEPADATAQVRNWKVLKQA
jgi:DNA-binding MarR family transcriptional regulator